ncbi:subtilisin inhibitor CLSI-I-like [Gastrolobium bilobum]|uniref:subtilisin inhibitor CLSI-I-like n=1 Tax=Gastrolobium bilobum TaxID=150636 RepID=UPI002AB07E15|nr:subtilisin inhibitor CLSI-I-like [Gastrolobium bilobum]XP_061357486.1 subtilisin inhibitor CLSI-I-like [Gastrolobium bilobum]
MAEEKQGYGTNPPQEQPNESLPRSYNQLLGTNNPTKTSWPELVGVTAEEAEKKIKEEMAGVEIRVVLPNYGVTCDYKTQRVRLYVDESKKVIETPMIG